MRLIGTRATAALITAVVAVTACGNSSSSTTKTKVDSVTFAASLQLASLDAILENLVPVNDTIYDPLTQITAKGGLAPALATKWSGNSDATKWTFTLRTGVKFQDGSPFTADDVVWTYQTIQNAATSQQKSYLAGLDTITKTSDTEVVFNFKTPSGSWPRQVTLIPIVPKKAYTAIGPAAFASKPVGTGPYKVVSFQANQQLVLQANKDYWGGAPPITNATELVIANETTRLTSLQSRSIDAAVLSPATAQTARTDKGLTVQSQLSNLVTYLGFNTTTAPLDSLKFRQAIDMAIDRPAIAKSLFHGDAQPIGQVLAPASFGNDPSIKPTTYDAAKAKQLVQDSGYKGQAITLTWVNGPALPQGPEFVQAIDGYLKSAGINTNLKSEDQTTFVNDWFGRKFPGIFFFSFQPSTLDAQLVYNLMLTTTNYFTDPALSALFVKQQGQSDSTARAATLSEIAKLIQSNVYFSALLNGTIQYVSVSSKIKLAPRADGYLEPQFFSPA